MSIDDIIVRAQAGDRKAQDDAIRYMDKSVKYFANKYARFGSTFDDLVQEGRLQVWYAIRTYRVGESATFMHYARKFLKRTMYQDVCRYRTAVRIPKRIVTEVVKTGVANPINTRAMPYIDDRDDSATAVAPVAHEHLQWRWLREQLVCLKPRTKAMLLDHADGMPLRAIGPKYGVTHERARQVIQSGLKLLQKAHQAPRGVKHAGRIH
jgi:RNA polymerase sigma factor (sigma-70 family)